MLGGETERCSASRPPEVHHLLAVPGRLLCACVCDRVGTRALLCGGLPRALGTPEPPSWPGGFGEDEAVPDSLFLPSTLSPRQPGPWCHTDFSAGHPTQFLDHGASDHLGRITVCCGGRPVHCRVVSSVSGLHPLEANNTPSPPAPLPHTL